MMTLFPCDNFEKNNTQWNMRNRTDAEAEAPVLWPPDAWSWLIGKDPDAGKDWRRKRGQEGMIWLDGITDSIDMNLSKVREIMKYREDWHATVHGVTKSWTWLNNWTNSKKSFFFFFFQNLEIYLERRWQWKSGPHKHLQQINHVWEAIVLFWLYTNGKTLQMLQYLHFKMPVNLRSWPL